MTWKSKVFTLTAAVATLIAFAMVAGSDWYF